MPRLIRGVARTAAIAGTATAVSNRVSRNQANRWAAQEQHLAAAQAPQAAPAPAPAAPVPAPAGGLSMDEKYAQLRQIAELKDEGILTEVEFEVQKAKILNG